MLTITDPKVQQFILENSTTDVATLMLKSARFPDMPMPEVVQQIKARQKAKKKLPEWFATPGIIFPPSISMEQCSSEATAKYKASLVSGSSMADITGGFGIDCYYLSKNFNRAHYIEQNEHLVNLAWHNFGLLGAKNITPEHNSAQNFLQDLPQKLSCIYLDPARRDENQQKVFRLQDCEPNVVELLPQMLKKAEKVLLKTAPVMDIDLAISELQLVEKVWVTTYQGECREVVYLLSENGNQNPQITAVNLLSDRTDEFSFYKSEEQNAEVELSEPLTFIYEPNPSLQKTGPFKLVCRRFGVQKLHPNSHLFTSAEIKPDFPGRIFKLLNIARANKIDLRQLLPSGKANITTRNYPDTVATLRKKTGLAEGGETYILATTDLHQKPILLICEKA